MVMRLLLIATLLVANLLFFVWARPPDPARTAAPPQPLPRLQLASEVPPPEKPARVAAVSDPALSASCVSLGPYRDEASRMTAESALRAAGFEPRIRTAIWDVPEGWWAYVGNLASGEEQRRVLSAIRRAGIEDASLPDRDIGNRVSVGVFSEQARAERRAEAVRRLGFPAVVEEYRRPASLHWLEIEGTGGDPQRAAVLQGQTAAQPGLELGACVTSSAARGG